MRFGTEGLPKKLQTRWKKKLEPKAADTTFWMPPSQVEADSILGPSESPWDVLYLDGTMVPGKISLEGDVGIRLEMKQPKGKSEARLEYSGYRAANVKFEIALWRPEHWSAYTKLLAKVIPQNSTEIPKPVKILHPILAEYGVKEIVIKSMSFPKGVQEKVVTVEAVQYLSTRWYVQEKASKDKDGKTLGERANTDEPTQHQVPTLGSEKLSELPPEATDIRLNGIKRVEGKQKEETKKNATEENYKKWTHTRDVNNPATTPAPSP